MSSNPASPDQNPSEDIPKGIPFIEPICSVPPPPPLHTEVIRRHTRSKRKIPFDQPSSSSARPYAKGADQRSIISRTEVAYFPGHFHCIGYTFCALDLSECPYDVKEGEMAVYVDSLSMEEHFLLGEYYQSIVDTFMNSPAQLTPNSWSLMAAFGALCYQYGFRPNARMFISNFKISKAPQDDDYGLYAFSSKQNVFLVGLSSKIDNFRKRWCWVRGPGILFNPQWRIPATNSVIDHYDAEVNQGARIREWVSSGDDFKVKELIAPVVLTDAGVITLVPPFDVYSSPSDDQPSDHQSSDHQSSHHSDSTNSIFDELTPHPNPISPYHPIPLSPSLAADSDSEAFSFHQDEAHGEAHVDIDIDTEWFDDPSMPIQRETGNDASVETEASGYYFVLQSFCLLYFFHFSVFFLLNCSNTFWILQIWLPKSVQADLQRKQNKQKKQKQ
ncbi:hypothetical protein Dimus_038537 [Dionaea muscipula]